MKNVFGQEISVGSVVTPGRRRTTNCRPAVGVVVEMYPRKRPQARTDELCAKVRFVSMKGIFTSVWAVEDLIVVDEASLGPEWIELLDQQYLKVMIDQKSASEFIPEG